MIKKAVLPMIAAPFLMVFSDLSYAWSHAPGGSVSATSWINGFRGAYYSDYSTSTAYCGSSVKPMSDCISQYTSAASAIAATYISLRGDDGYVYSISSSSTMNSSGAWTATYSVMRKDADEFKSDPTSRPPGAAPDEPVYNQKKTDEECSSENGSTFNTSDPAVYNYLNSGGSVRTHGGACSVSLGGGVSACTGSGESMQCSIPIESSSTGQNSKPNIGIDGALLPPGQPQVDPDYSTPDYLSPVPGGCSDPSSCVTIGDTSYLVDWDSAPDYFSYVDANGTTHSNPSSGGGGGSGGGDPTDPTDPTDPGGDNSGGDDSGNDDSDDNNGGGSSGGGGSTVPDFEFDESGIIEAIGSAGRSNRNAINALSNDVTGAISNQTDDLNTATTAQTDTLTSSLDDQTDDLTGAIDSQTGTLTDSLDALGTTFTDALDGLGLGSIGDDTGDGDGEGDGEGEGEDSEGDGLLGGISKLLNRMVDKLASTFTEDLGNGDDLFDSSGMDDTLDGVATQEEEHSDEINSLMEEIGDGATSGIADQITSRLPSLPSGGCVPLQFGPMEISCQAFNTIKLWLTWIIYFWTVVSIVDIFFRSEQRTA